MGKVSIVAVFVGPHHAADDPTCRDWATVPGLTFDGFGRHQHVGMLCMGRVDAGIAIAERLGCTLVVCGDSNSGSDVRVLVEHAKAHGMKAAVGVHQTHSNTRMDAANAVRFATETGASVVDLYIVTDWWHLPRAYVHAWNAARSVNGCRIRVRPRPAFGWIPPLVYFWGEVRGIFHALLGRPHSPMPGKPLGKPDAEKLQRERSRP